MPMDKKDSQFGWDVGCSYCMTNTLSPRELDVLKWSRAKRGRKQVVLERRQCQKSESRQTNGRRRFSSHRKRGRSGICNYSDKRQSCYVEAQPACGPSVSSSQKSSCCLLSGWFLPQSCILADLVKGSMTSVSSSAGRSLLACGRICRRCC